MSGGGIIELVTGNNYGTLSGLQRKIFVLSKKFASRGKMNWRVMDGLLQQITANSRK